MGVLIMVTFIVTFIGWRWCMEEDMAFITKRGHEKFGIFAQRSVILAYHFPVVLVGLYQLDLNSSRGQEIRLFDHRRGFKAI